MSDIIKDYEKDIPVKVMEFIKLEKDVYCEWIDKKSDNPGVLQMDLILKDARVIPTIYLEQNRPITLRFDGIRSSSALFEDYLKNSTAPKERIEEIHKRMKDRECSIKEKIQEEDYSYYSSHQANDGITEYWDMVIFENIWYSPFILDIWKEIDTHIENTLMDLDSIGITF